MILVIYYLAQLWLTRASSVTGACADADHGWFSVPVFLSKCGIGAKRLQHIHSYTPFNIASHAVVFRRVVLPLWEGGLYYSPWNDCMGGYVQHCWIRQVKSWVPLLISDGSRIDQTRRPPKISEVLQRFWRMTRRFCEDFCTHSAFSRNIGGNILIWEIKSV